MNDKIKIDYEMFYYLDEDKNAIPCNCEKWAKQLEELTITGSKHVACDTIENLRVSTVWIGLNHGYKPPLIFETMIFKNDRVILQRRYSSWIEAEEGHKEIIQQIKYNPGNYL